MEIEIVYQTWDDPAPVRLLLSPEEYFDPLEEGETYEADGIPRYNHTWEYLDVALNRLKWSTERVRGTQDDKFFRTQYMDEGRSWMNHRLDPGGSEEIIHYTQLAPDCCHILRTLRTPSGAWIVLLNSVIVNQSDGSEKEQRFDGPWDHEEVLACSRQLGKLAADSAAKKESTARPAPGLGKGSILYMAPDFDGPIE